MNSIRLVTDETFESVIQNEKLTLIDFWANWCQPCLALLPTLEDIAKIFEDNILIYKMDVDENFNIPNMLGIRTVPYLLLTKNGEIKDSLVGNQAKEKIITTLRKHL